MMRRALLAAVLGALAMFVAVSPAHAAQEFFLVTGTADGTGACAPYPDFPGGFSCTTLRAAISAANANPGEDVVVLQATGTYPVSSMFLLTDNIEIAGQNAQTTFLNGNDDRLFEVAPDVSAVLYGVTLQNGVAPAGDGGAVINNGTLELDYSRVTQSSTVSGNGSGILNNGNLVLNGALIDDNDSGGFDGGGIYSEGSVTAIDSTIFANTGGGGIYSFQGASLSLIHVTVAGNTSGSGSAGVHTGGLSWSSTGSLFVSNTGDGVQKQNCDAVPSGTGNMDDGVTCEVTSKTTAQIGLATTLQNLGGQTDVLAIPHTSAAKASGRRASRAPTSAGRPATRRGPATPAPSKRAPRRRRSRASRSRRRRRSAPRRRRRRPPSRRRRRRWRARASWPSRSRARSRSSSRARTRSSTSRSPRASRTARRWTRGTAPCS